VTPSSYSPENHASHHRTHNRIEGNLQIRDKESTFDDPDNYDLEKPNLKRALKNLRKESGFQQNKNSSNGTNKPYRVRR
jgi:hypothetical protein